MEYFRFSDPNEKGNHPKRIRLKEENEGKETSRLRLNY